MADLVVADLTLDNPNVWYELGVRHALRARGVVLVQGPRAEPALRHLHRPQAALRPRRTARPTRPRSSSDRDSARGDGARHAEAWHRAGGQPGVQRCCHHLREPRLARRCCWRSATNSAPPTRIGASRMEVARAEAPRRRHPGAGRRDTDARAAARSQARRRQLPAQAAATSISRSSSSTPHWRSTPTTKPAARKSARLPGPARPLRGSARVDAPAHASDYPDRRRGLGLRRPRREGQLDPALAPRRRHAGADARRPRRSRTRPAEARSSRTTSAFVADPSHYYSGINALTLHGAAQHLGGDADQAVDRQPDRRRAVGRRSRRRSATARTTGRAPARPRLCLLVNPLEAVSREYRAAVAAAEARLVCARLDAPDAGAAARSGIPPRGNCGRAGSRRRARSHAPHRRSNRARCSSSPAT